MTSESTKDQTNPQSPLSNPAIAQLAAFVGAWTEEKSEDGMQWDYDFDLTYTKLSEGRL